MHDEFLSRMERAHDHVKDEPGDGQPSRPIVPSQHEKAANHRYDRGAERPQSVEWKGMMWLNVARVEGKPRHTN